MAFTRVPGPPFVGWIQVCGWVGERRVPGEAAVEASGGRFTSENAGMSSDTHVRNVCAD